MIAAHLIEPSGQSIGLKSLVFTKFGVEMTEIEALIGKGKNQITMDAVDVALVTRYACADADYTYRLVDLYRPQLEEQGFRKLFDEVEMPLVPVLMEMEETGVLLDLDFLKKMSGELTKRLAGIGNANPGAGRRAAEHRVAAATGGRALQQAGAADGQGYPRQRPARSRPPRTSWNRCAARIRSSR